MANPNIVNVTTINGTTAVANVTTVSANLVENSASSNTVIKINSLLISNIDGSNPASVDVALFRSSVSYHIAKTITVPADSTLDLLNKAIYLNEGDTLTATSSANDVLQAVCSYEVIG